MDAPVPKDISKMDSLKPVIEKLPEKDRELFAGYVVRQGLSQALGGLTGKSGAGIPVGMTVGKAIADQKKFLEERSAEEAKQKALADKLKAERETAMKAMRDLVTVTLVSKKIVEERGMSGLLLDEHLSVTFGYKNNASKDISGVKGRIVVKDLFGDELSAFQVSNDDSIAAGSAITWTGARSVKYGSNTTKDRKLADLPDDKFTVVWEPQVIIFKDGTKMTITE